MERDEEHFDLDDEFVAGAEDENYDRFIDRVDRRKDLFLQQQGYLVLRFLAADVVSRLEEILAAVTSALRGRHETENPNGEAKT